MFKLFGRRKRREIEAEENKNALLQKIVDLRNKAYWKGMHLLDQPFIPQYLGFEEYVNKDSHNITIGRIYHKNGVNISKPIDGDMWYLITDELKPDVPFKIDNMFHAIVLFESLGIPGISVAKYIEKSQKDTITTEKELSLIR